MNNEKTYEYFLKNRSRIRRVIKELLGIDIEYNQKVSSGSDDLDEINLLRDFQKSILSLRLEKNTKRKYKRELDKKNKDK